LGAEGIVRYNEDRKERLNPNFSTVNKVKITII
jgi:hypothetical protein